MQLGVAVLLPGVAARGDVAAAAVKRARELTLARRQRRLQRRRGWDYRGERRRVVLLLRPDRRVAPRLGFGRIVVLVTEVPNMLVNLV